MQRHGERVADARVHDAAAACDSATCVVLAAVGLGLGLLSPDVSVVAVSPHALTESARRAAAPIAPMTPIFLLTSHLR